MCSNMHRQNPRQFKVMKTLDGTHTLSARGLYFSGAYDAIFPGYQFSDDPKRPFGTRTLTRTTPPTRKQPFSFLPLTTRGNPFKYSSRQRDQHMFNFSSLEELHLNNCSRVGHTGSSSATSTARLTTRPIRKWAGVSGCTASTASPTNVIGREFTHASISIKTVLSSCCVRQRTPRVFFNADLIDRINRSHHPPHHGDLGAMNFHLGAHAWNDSRIH